jgi:hypothetical protein
VVIVAAEVVGGRCEVGDDRAGCLSRWLFIRCWVMTFRDGKGGVAMATAENPLTQVSDTQ